MLEVGVLQVQHPDGQVFAFEPGSVSMALAITGAPGGWFEALRVPQDLGAWAARVTGVAAVPASTADLALARRLRSAIWGAADAVIEGRTPSAAHRRVLNDAARGTPIRPQLGADGRGGWVRPVTAAAVLSAVAEDAIGLFGGPRVGRVKRCQGRNCAIPFVDTSRPGTRRWCSMDRCGNRAKARTQYRQRKEVSWSRDTQAAGRVDLP